MQSPFHVPPKEPPPPVGQPAAAPVGGLRRISRGQVIRVLIGLAIVAVGAAVLMPRLLFTLSSQAIINARVISLTAPIDGRVVQAPPPEGSMVQSGSRLLSLENTTVDRSWLDELKGARTRADGERVAAETLAKSLRELLIRLDRQFTG